MKQMDTELFDGKPFEAQKRMRRTPDARVQVEDDRTGLSIPTLKRAIKDNLYYTQGKSEKFATRHDYYMAVSHTVRDRLMHRWIKTMETLATKKAKVVCYLSAEFLMGRHLGNNLVNAGMWEATRQACEELDLNIHDILEQEPDPGLGNGGLGRLAACFMDSLATLEIPAVGYGIRYEFGIFEQMIKNGWQVERPDKWLRLGNPWEIERPERTFEVKFGGYTEPCQSENGEFKVRWVPARTVLGTPYDTLVPGYNVNTVNTLRLWSAGASRDFDFQVFNDGDYTRAVAEKTFSENISKVLYPNDNTPQGRELRLQQQYFFVSCSLQDIIRYQHMLKRDLMKLYEFTAVQLNDTHPAIAVAELMRLLLDENDIPWDKAWETTQKTLAFTNHTLLAEALEKWPVSMLGRVLPRHLEIIYEINRRFLEEVRATYPGDDGKAWRMSLIEEAQEKQIRMANLACVGSHAINGVAELHTKLLKDKVLSDFHELWPEKFSAKTNGVTPRRWLLLSNPKLSLEISEKIGRDWVADLDQLRKLEPLAQDTDFQNTWRQIKQDNKEDLAEVIKELTGVEVRTDAIYDIQVKRIHEYKRQLLFALYIVTLYLRLKENPKLDMTPRVCIVAGKAAPGYHMAKLVIKLINSIADVVNNDPDVGDKLKVVFLPNFSVTLGERIYPAADLSEQISMAGKEASGTGNMKFALNGALTIGTLDGANVEIREAVGEDNFFLFGLNVNEVAEMNNAGYHPLDFHAQNAELRGAIEAVSSGRFSPDRPSLFEPLVNSLLYHDEYMLLADFAAYVECQDRVSEAYRDQKNWTRMSILNTARVGKFSSDRSMRDYIRDIWKTKPLNIKVPKAQLQKSGVRTARKAKR